MKYKFELYDCKTGVVSDEWYNNVISPVNIAAHCKNYVRSRVEILERNDQGGYNYIRGIDVV